MEIVHKEPNIVLIPPFPILGEITEKFGGGESASGSPLRRALLSGPCPALQEMFCIYCALIAMVAEHNKALSPFMHLRFWERRGFGELHGAHTKAPIVLEAEGRTCPFRRRGSRQEKSLL